MDIPQAQTDDVVQHVAMQLDRVSGPPLYRQIASLVRDRIRRGDLKTGYPLPAQRQLSDIWQVGEVTIRRALQQLASEGLIEARPGSGTVIRSPHSPRPSHDTASLTLGVAFTDLANGYPFFPPVLNGLRTENCDVAIRLFDVPPSVGDHGVEAHEAALAGLDGLIMMSPVNVALLTVCQQKRLPTVLLFSEIADGFSHCIVPDYGSGIVDTIGHLVAAGRRRIALVTAGPERFSTGRWLDAYRAALRAHRLPAGPEQVRQAGYAENDGAQATRQLLAAADRPDAILFASDFMARGGLLAAHELGVRVPQELALVGAGPVLHEGGWTVPLATIDLGLHEMGRLARLAIQATLTSPDTPPRRHAVPARFQPGGTA